MKYIRSEEAVMFGLTIYLFSRGDFAWWWYPALILAPDIGILGYVINNRVGAITYNLFHHKGLALILYIAGLQYNMPVLQLAGLILFGHASMDRMFGFGLKYPDGFRYTHLEVVERG